jgi:SpoVK/Ycf46/Vps4 family AAA+-type ATPase
MKMQKEKIIKALQEAAEAVKTSRNGLLLLVESENLREAKWTVSDFAMRSFQRHGIVTLVFGDEDIETKLMYDLILQTRSSLMVLLVVVTDRSHELSPAAIRDGKFDFKVAV